MKKKIFALILAASVSATVLSGCTTPLQQVIDSASKTETDSETETETETEDVTEESTESSTTKSTTDGDVIVAGTIDTSSKYSFTVDTALIGYDEWDDDVYICYIIGEFTNNSDDVMSFSSAVDITAKQDGITLYEAYISGLSAYNYNEIKPGESMSILVGFEIENGQDDITITAIDRTHYAKEVLYEGSFTIDELVNNTIYYASEYDEIINDDGIENDNEL